MESFNLTEVKRPNIGETKPAEVRADVQFSLKTFGGEIREEWRLVLATYS